MNAPPIASGIDPEIDAAKAAMRAQMAPVRAAAQAAHPDAGVALAQRLPRQLWPEPGQVVSGYWPFRSEIDSLPLLRRLARRGARLALPVTPPRGSGQALSFRAWTPEAELAPGAFKVREPLADAALTEPDLLLVPLLAFDRFGGRLGYGQGHFDRTIAGLRARKAVRVLGLAFSAQEVAATPGDMHDQRLDGIVTERAYIAVD